MDFVAIANINCKLPSSLAKLFFVVELSQIPPTLCIIICKIALIPSPHGLRWSIAKPLFRRQKVSQSVVMCFIILVSTFSMYLSVFL